MINKIKIEWLYGRPNRGAEDDESKMSGLALLWIEARKAADLALTDGWFNQDGASCDIRAGWSGLSDHIDR